MSHPEDRSALLTLDQMRPRPPSAAPRQDASHGVVVPLPAVRDNTALLEGLRAREPWARAALFERYAPHVHRLLRKILGPRPQLEVPDLIHDVFVQVLVSIEQLREPGAMLPWIQAVTTRIAFRALRAHRARRWLRFWEPGDLDEVSSAPDVDVETMEAYRRTYAVLDRMGAEDRVVFVLRHVERMELSPIAAACGLSLATLKRRLARAEQRFLAAAQGDEVLRRWLEEGDRWTT